MPGKRKPHVCENRYAGEGARGGCYVNITASDQKDANGDPMARLEVGWSCVVTVGSKRNPGDIPVSWLSEILTIAADHEGGFAGFLAEHGAGGSDGSYALEVDPPKEGTNARPRQR